MKPTETDFPVQGVYGIFALIVIISLTYGFGYRFMGDVWYFQVATAAFLGVFLVLAYLYWRLGNAPLKMAMGGGDFPGFVMVSISLALSFFFYSQVLSPIPWYVAASVLCMAGLLCYRRWGMRVGVSVLVLGGLVFDMILINKVPIDIKAANMLPFVESAARQFLGAESPYRTYQGIAGGAFFYLPGLWLPYVPFVAAGVDLRVFNIVCLVILVTIFTAQSRSNQVRPALACAGYSILLSPPITQMVINGHIWSYWVFLLLTAWCLRKGALLPACLLFGLTLATRQPAIFLMGPLAVYSYQQLGLAATIRFGVLALIIYLALVIPFSTTAKEGGWLSWYFVTYAGMFFDPNQIGAASSLREWGLDRVARYLQVLVSIVTMVGVWKIPKQDCNATNLALFVIGLGYLGFVFFNPYVARYLYFPGLFLMAFSVTSWAEPSAPAGPGILEVPNSMANPGRTPVFLRRAN